RDAGEQEPAGKTLTDAANTAKMAETLLADAGVKANSGKAEDAATLRDQAEAQLRAAAGKAAGAGPPTTTLPGLDPNKTAIGDSLRRAELALRQAAQNADAKAMRTAAEALKNAAKGIAERLATNR